LPHVWWRIRAIKDHPDPRYDAAFIGLFISYVITDLLLGSQMPEEMQVNALDRFVDIYLHGILGDHEWLGQRFV
jgi:hypothetical protein